jgi:hypothetical protein
MLYSDTVLPMPGRHHMPNGSRFEPDKDKIRHLAALLRQAINHELNSSGLTTLVREAARIALSRNYPRMCSAAEVQGVCAEDLAVTSVGEMFALCHGSLGFVKDLVEFMDSDAAVVARFMAVAATKAGNFLFHTLEHSDRNGFNLTRNLKAALRTDHCFRQWPDEQPQFVTLVRCKDFHSNRIAWTQEEISRLVWVSGEIGDSASMWLEKVLELVVADPLRTHFVERSMLLQTFREVSRQMIEEELVRSLKSAGPESEVMRKARELIDTVRPLAHKMLDRFVEKGRLVKSERECLGLALDDYLDDMRETGEPGQSRYDYVKDHWPGLTTDHYKKRFKSPFQTTLSFVHQYIRRGLRGELR